MHCRNFEANRDERHLPNEIRIEALGQTEGLKDTKLSQSSHKAVNLSENSQRVLLYKISKNSFSKMF